MARPSYYVDGYDSSYVEESSCGSVGTFLLGMVAGVISVAFLATIAASKNRNNLI